MSHNLSLAAVFFMPLLIGVLSFFAYKFLTVARQMIEIRHFIQTLHTHASREEANLIRLHEKLDSCLLRQGEIMEKIIAGKG